MKKERCCANCEIYETCPKIKEVKEAVVNERISIGLYNKAMRGLLEERAFHQCEIRSI